MTLSQAELCMVCIAHHITMYISITILFHLMMPVQQAQPQPMVFMPTEHQQKLRTTSYL